MQSVIALFLGLILALGGMLLTKGAVMSGLPLFPTGLVGWVVSLLGGVFLTTVALVVLGIGTFVYGAVFRALPLVGQVIVSMLMSSGCLFVIWIAPRVSRRSKS